MFRSPVSYSSNSPAMKLFPFLSRQVFKVATEMDFLFRRSKKKMLIFQIIIMVMHDREIFRQWYEAAVLSRLNNRRPSESWRAPSAYKQITCLSTHARASMRLAHKKALCNSSLDMQEEHVAFYTFSWKLHGWFQVYDSNSFSIFCSCSHSVPCTLPTPLLHAPPIKEVHRLWKDCF